MGNSSKYSSMINQIKTYCGDLDGAVMMDIGCDKAGQLVKEVSESLNIKHITGVNPIIKENRYEDKFTLLKGDSRDLEFEDNTFDCIISLAGFEHFYDLDVALKELYRVLRPGGKLFTVFGPLWSSAWGHHLWINHNGKVYSYSNMYLPPYCHLLMTDAQLKSHLQDFEGITDEKLLSQICEFVFKSEEQNRLFYSDYQKIIYESPFDVLFFTGHKEFPLSPNYKHVDYYNLLYKLRKRYPEKTGFGYHVITTLLGKEK